MPSKITLAEQLPLAITSLCLGRAAVHELGPKIKAAADAGYKGIELFYEDIKLPAKRLSQQNERPFEENLLTMSQYFRDLCDEHSIAILSLQPFKNYEGLLSEKRKAEKIQKLKLWFKMAKILGTNIIQIPSNFHSEGTTSDHQRIAADLRQVADLGAKESPPIRFVYENMAWGAHVNHWQDINKIVKLVDRENFGMLLDTFQILASMYADPTSPSGVVPNADQILEEDLAELKREVDPKKVFYIQLADGERLSTPMGPSHPWYNPKQHPRLTWSRNARLFPCEENRGGYLPVLRMLDFWINEFGYRGWVSMEVFNRSMFEKNREVPREHAERGVVSWKNCVDALKLDQ